MFLLSINYDFARLSHPVDVGSSKNKSEVWPSPNNLFWRFLLVLAMKLLMTFSGRTNTTFIPDRLEKGNTTEHSS